MAYQVTATRKRPQNFDRLAGQEFVVATLKNSLETGRIAHAYLFAGPRGVGKTSAARILAKALNCEQGPTVTPCGECENCREITAGGSLDVIEIDGASNTSVNDVREIKDEVLFAPSAARYKVYIIDEVHMLSNSAFNALLKTIEEPPPYIVFVFATTEVHKVPATIRSRCQQFNFRMVSLETIRGLLAGVASESGVEADDDALLWIAKEATGSVRDAYTLFDQVVSFSDERITMELIRNKLGLVGLDRLNDLMELLTDAKSAEALELASEIMARGVSVEQLIVDLAEYLRNILFIKHGIRKTDILGAPVTGFSTRVVEAHSDAQIEHALGLTVKLYRDMRYSLNQRLELELLLSRLSLLSGYIHPSELKRGLSRLKDQMLSGLADAGLDVDENGGSGEGGDEGGRGIDGGAQGGTDSGMFELSGTETTAETTAETADQDPSLAMSEGGTSEGAGPSLSFNRSDLEDMVAGLGRKHPTLASALEKTVRWSLDDDTLTIVCPSRFHAENIRKDMPVLAGMVRDRTGASINVVVETENEAAEKKSPEDDGGAARRIDMIKQVFRGEVIDGEGT